MSLTHRGKMRRGWMVGGAALAVFALVEGPFLMRPRHGKLASDGRRRELKLIWPDADTNTLLHLARMTTFDRYGLDVTVINAANGDSALDALTNGSVDAAAVPLLDLLPRLHATPTPELPGLVLCGLGGGSFRLLAATRGTEIHRVVDLAGKSIGVQRLDGLDQRFAAIRLRRRGINPVTGVRWVVLQEADFDDALRNGRVDALVAHDPLAWEVMQATKGMSTTVISSLTGADRERTNLVLTLSAARLAADPDLAAMLILAMQEAAAAWPEQKAALASMLSDLPDPVPQPEKMLAQEVPPHIVTGHDLIVEMAESIDEMKLIGSIPDGERSSVLAHRLCHRTPGAG
ncbi:ABC transporter substrate-binding protein [Acidomonas methanolica]|nr:ABC transporter substrate-binding protein [Acidomonas methanolica]MBU2654952.1 ABC transporter substrate-binding protein [Acidomonas methanolica]TCS26303.1 ABC-type nitrate/sulfonate/bicarbonate transport system substrate-binding protein [Acidomonas methanolica]